MTTSVDLVVIGGGPVGLVSALYAVRSGLQVVVLEPRDGTIDKACGEGLMPGALASLHGLGLDPPGHTLTGIAYTDGTRRATADFGPQAGRGVRRTTLHRCLADAATRAGVATRHTAMRSVTQDDDAVTVTTRDGSADLRAAHVIAADGLHSPTRRALGLQVTGRGRRRHGLRQHFACRPWTDHVEVHWGADAEAYVTPVADDVVGVAVLTGRQATWSGLIRGFPALGQRLGGAAPVSELRGAGPLRQVATSRLAGRVLLVGDAGGYVDALTGEGLSVGFAEARAAVTAISTERVGRYPALARSVSWRSSLLTTGLLAATGPAWPRRHLVPAAAMMPWAFGWAVRELATAR